MNDIVLLGKALSDPTRVRILHALLRSDLCVCEMVDALELGQSTLSAHLQTIRQAGIVETSRRHKMVSYALTMDAKRLIEPIFQDHDDALSVDHRLTRDRARIQERLNLRSQGQCVFGPGQLDRAEDTKK